MRCAGFALISCRDIRARGRPILGRALGRLDPGDRAAIEAAEPALARLLAALGRRTDPKDAEAARRMPRMERPADATIRRVVKGGIRR